MSNTMESEALINHEIAASIQHWVPKIWLLAWMWGNCANEETGRDTNSFRLLSTCHGSGASNILSLGASLLDQWLGIHLPMQGTRAWALVGEDPTCREVTKPMCHNYWACALEPTSHNYWAHVPQLQKPTRLKPVLRNKRSYRKEKPAHRNEE